MHEATDNKNASSATIVDFDAGHARDFARLNYAWIEEFFSVEEPDRQALDRPQEKILQPGGHILIALLDGTVVGTCALMKVSDECYELTKMAVDPQAQGQNIGLHLATAAIERARATGATSIHLETSTKLGPAIALYRKLGFHDANDRPTPYARCNLQMVLHLDDETQPNS